MYMYIYIYTGERANTAASRYSRVNTTTEDRRPHQTQPYTLPRGFQRFGFENHLRAGGVSDLAERVRFTYGV